MFRTFYLHFIKLPILSRIIVISVSLILFFGTLIHFIEPSTFNTIFDGIWWAFITASTVGYGDHVPHTLAGRLTAILLIIAGTGFVSSYFIHLSAATVTKQNQFLEGKMHYKGQSHTIIVGWNERSRKIIHTLTAMNQDIVLIDETLDRHPFTTASIHFLKGRPNRDEMLHKAKISSASTVIITADQNLDEVHADMNTILTVLAIKGLNPTVRCIAEILTEEQENNAMRAGADELIRSNIIMSEVILSKITIQSERFNR